MKQKTTLMITLLSLLIFLVYISILGISPDRLFTLLHSIDPRFYLLAIVLDTGYIVFYAVSWFFLVRTIYPIKLWTAIKIVMIGWFGDMLVPAAFITGEATRIYLLKRTCNTDYTKAIAIAVMHRLLSTVAFITYVSTGTLLLMHWGTLSSMKLAEHIMFALALALIALVIGFLLVFKEDLIKKSGLLIFNYLAKSFEKIKLEKYKKKVLEAMQAYEESMKLIKEKPAGVFLCFIFMLFQWGLGVALPYLFFKALGYSMSYWALAVAYPIYGLADNIPLGIPANAGVLDLAMTSLFIIMGATKEVALSVTLLTRSVTVVYEGILTGIVTILVIPKIIGEISIRNLINGLKNISKQVI